MRDLPPFRRSKVLRRTASSIYRSGHSIEGGVQCGFCTPGMLMSAKALIDATPRPGQGEIRRQLAGNLCRCTGYQRDRGSDRT